jgi:hypothetical protein
MTIWMDGTFVSETYVLNTILPAYLSTQLVFVLSILAPHMLSKLTMTSSMARYLITSILVTLDITFLQNLFFMKII